MALPHEGKEGAGVRRVISWSSKDRAGGKENKRGKNGNKSNRTLGGGVTRGSWESKGAGGDAIKGLTQQKRVGNGRVLRARRGAIWGNLQTPKDEIVSKVKVEVITPHEVQKGGGHPIHRVGSEGMFHTQHSSHIFREKARGQDKQTPTNQ